MRKRKIFLPLCLFLSFYLGQAQLIMIDGETGEYKYEEVVEVQGLSKDQIAQRAKKWISIYYSSEDSIRTDSAGISKLCGQKLKWVLIRKGIEIEIFFDVNVKTKDGRYKYAFSDFREGKMVRGEVQSIPLKKYIDRFPQTYQISIEEPVDSEITKAISSLMHYIETNQMEVSEEDW